MRANEIKRERDISALESESHSIDPAQHTDMATMQRMNQAMLLQLRQQQEANQIQQGVALQQMITLKQQQDVMKQGFRTQPVTASITKPTSPQPTTVKRRP